MVGTPHDVPVPRNVSLTFLTFLLLYNVHLGEYLNIKLFFYILLNLTAEGYDFLTGCPSPIHQHQGLLVA